MTNKTTIYMDGAASTPVAPRVIERLTHAYRTLYGNPSSLHAAGTAARSEVELARRIIAGHFGVLPRELHFTSGATESNNLAIAGVARGRRKGHLISVATEHPSVLSPIRELQSEGFEATLLPVGSDGTLDLELLARSIRPDTFLVSAMMVNNETGLLNPVRDIGRLARERGVLFHCDATQAMKTYRIKPKELGIHLLSASGHKIYGPKGVGLLYVDKELAENRLAFGPLLHGGKQEQGIRAGTENVPAICGLAEAFVLLDENLEKDHRESKEKRDLFLNGLSGIPLVVNGRVEHSSPSIVNFRIEGVEAISMMRDLDHLQVSAGSACSGAMPSHVLTAMGISGEHVAQSLRFCFGREVSHEEVRRAAADISEYVTRVS